MELSHRQFVVVAEKSYRIAKRQESADSRQSLLVAQLGLTPALSPPINSFIFLIFVHFCSFFSCSSVLSFFHFWWWNMPKVSAATSAVMQIAHTRIIQPIHEFTYLHMYICMRVCATHIFICLFAWNSCCLMLHANWMRNISRKAMSGVTISPFKCVTVKQQKMQTTNATCENDKVMSVFMPLHGCMLWHLLLTLLLLLLLLLALSSLAVAF